MNKEGRQRIEIESLRSKLAEAERERDELFLQVGKHADVPSFEYWKERAEKAERERDEAKAVARCDGEHFKSKFRDMTKGNQRLSIENSEWQQTAVTLLGERDAIKADRDHLHKRLGEANEELSRLRGALEHIRDKDVACSPCSGRTHEVDYEEHVRQIAKKALQPQASDSEDGK